MGDQKNKRKCKNTVNSDQVEDVGMNAKVIENLPGEALAKLDSVM